MRIKRVMVAAFICTAICINLTGCFDKREVDDLTYAIAIGIDKGKVNPIKITIQYAIPLAMGGGGDSDGKGGGGSKSIGVTTVEAPAIFSGLNMMNNYVGKQINMAHAKVVVFSEELAKSGEMHDYLHSLVRAREFRPNINIAVARGSSEDYIKSIKPVQEANPAKYYELKFSSFKYTGYTADVQLITFYNDQEDYGSQAVATLVGVGKYESSNDIDPEKSTYVEKGRDKPLMGDYKAGDIPKAGDVKGETLGLAAFDGAKMVGELDGQESTLYLIASGEFRNSFVTFPDPEQKESSIVLNLKQSRKPQYKISLDNGKPNIDIKIKLEGDFLSIRSGINYEEGQKLEEFQTSGEVFLKGEILRFLNRTSKEFNSDICDFGRFAKSKFLTWDQWTSFNWLGRYKDASFNVDVDLKIRRTGLMIRSLPAVSSKGLED